MSVVYEEILTACNSNFYPPPFTLGLIVDEVKEKLTKLLRHFTQSVLSHCYLSCWQTVFSLSPGWLCLCLCKQLNPHLAVKTQFHVSCTHLHQYVSHLETEQLMLNSLLGDWRQYPRSESWCSFLCPCSAEYDQGWTEMFVISHSHES